MNKPPLSRATATSCIANALAWQKHATSFRDQGAQSNLLLHEREPPQCEALAADRQNDRWLAGAITAA